MHKSNKSHQSLKRMNSEVTRSFWLCNSSNPNGEGRAGQRALCRLKHRELLDAALIIPDNMPEGKSTIENGLSLCKLHHSAYDAFIIGVTPDYIIQVRADILEEEDGPVLQHGLKGLHKSTLILPSSKSHYPSREALDWRYSRFTRAG
jgi:putative restriction endonuclease